MQVVDARGRLLFRSDNLSNDRLLYMQALEEPEYFNLEFNGNLIRIGQFPVFNEKGALTGQLSIGLPQVEANLILANLRLTLFLAFPIMLLVFFLATSLAASHGIAPVHDLIKATRSIGYGHSKMRIPLPVHQDEIHQLAATFNALLERVDLSLLREKQITADISHELRTPLTGIRGTLEVLVRKTREPGQYEDKIRQVIAGVDNMNRIIDQLLQLSRLDAGTLEIRKSEVKLSPLVKEIFLKRNQELEGQRITVKVSIPESTVVTADQAFLEIMVDNLVSNSIKYVGNQGEICCTWNASERLLAVTDNGPGISEEQLPFLFDRFYRTDASRSSAIPGNGLGLAIVKMLADIQKIPIEVSSEPGKGTSFTLLFAN